jgi:hypothetical protein
MIDIDKNLKIFYEREENKEDEYIGAISKHECVVDGWFVIELLEEVKRLREDYEKMSEVLRGHGMDICRHCRVIYRDDEMNHPHYPSLHPWHMDGMCMKEMIE